MKIKTRNQAIKDGDKSYYTGKPCIHGHLAARLIMGACLECKKEIDNNYKQKNKEHIKEYNKQYHKEYHKENYSTEERRKKYIENIELELFHHAKNRAKRKGLEFNLTKEDILIPKNCPVFDIPLNFDNKQNVPTLDRINNNEGYIKGNIQVISAKANRLKNNGSIEEFKRIISYMEIHSDSIKQGSKNGN
jgi:hypothetical protein